MTPKPYNQVRLGSDILAVVNSGAHTILMVELKDGAEIMRIGSGTMGFADGPAAEARFSNPRHVYNPSSPPLHLVVSFFLPFFNLAGVLFFFFGPEMVPGKPFTKNYRA